ncbi:hypothetical protein BS47DRAFT_1343282 [Hydnum rufescens UP504]|uniref:Uncharacterized protein n=1 Tax=Hydnum rufescens UP504 TaxID=1448309 RepID=A0A9P6DXT4_9AGAM|nr:hypothetical protein BS47DRAFT_1343282 [Hydnum rufescens UP504]
MEECCRASCETLLITCLSGPKASDNISSYFCLQRSGEICMIHLQPCASLYQLSTQI